VGERKKNRKYVNRENETSRGDGSSGHGPALADGCEMKVRDLGIFPGTAVPARERRSRTSCPPVPVLETLSAYAGLQQLLLPMVGGRVRKKIKSKGTQNKPTPTTSLSASAQTFLMEHSKPFTNAFPP